MLEEAKKLGINTGKEEDIETEDIKTEVHLHLDSSCSDCDNWNENNSSRMYTNNDSPGKRSRRGSQKE